MVYRIVDTVAFVKAHRETTRSHIFCLMSNPTYFLYDICDFNIKDMECMDIEKSDAGLETQDENQKVEKLKESHLLLKKKLSLSHELIKQYNDKIKECIEMGMELKTMKDNYKKLTINHNLSLAKINQLMIDNENCRQKIEKYSNIIPKQEIKIAADQQHLQQLICKIQELEKKEIIVATLRKDDPLKDKVKTLEAELKAAKESHKLVIKQMTEKFKNIKPIDIVGKNQTKQDVTKITHDKATCTGNELEPAIIKPEMMEKCTLTNEFYNVKDDPYPLFCTKCNVKFDLAPMDQILKQMTFCPMLITQVSSPSKKSEINKLLTSPRTLSQSESLAPQGAGSDVNNLSQSLDSMERNSDVSKSDLERLERKIRLLERKLFKKVKSENRNRNPYCSFQYPNNCYLGQYQNLFQPAGAMLQSRPDFLQFQNWREDLRNQKRNWRISHQRSSRYGIKSKRKKQKLEHGTSDWNVDPVPTRQFMDSDYTNVSENSAERSNKASRTESPLTGLRDPKHTIVSKRQKENETSPALRPMRRDQPATLVTPQRSPSPILYDNMDEELHSETRIESPRVSSVVNEIHSDEEIVINDTKTPEHTPEYETVECTPNTRGRSVKKVTKILTKNSLVTKIRNLKKNCNKIKPLVYKIMSTNNNTDRVTGNQIAATTIAVNKLWNSMSCTKPIKNDDTSNSVDNYCPVKRHRIAHNIRKIQNNSLSQTTQNLSEVPTPNVQNDSINGNATSNTIGEPVATIAELDKIGITEHVNNPETVVQIQRRNSIRDSIDTKSQLVEKPAVENLVVESIGKIATVEVRTESIGNNTLNTSTSAVNETFTNEKVIPLQPCVVIPRMYLDIDGVEGPREAARVAELIESGKEESATKLISNVDKVSSNDASPRILRSSTKIIKSNSIILEKNDSVNASKDLIDKSSSLSHSETMSRIAKVALTRCTTDILSPASPDNEISDSVSDINGASMSVTSDRSENVNNEILNNDKTAAIAASKKYKWKTIIEGSSVSPMRELRSRSIVLSPLQNLDKKNFINDENEETGNETLSKSGKLSENVITRSIRRHGPKALFEQLVIKRLNTKQKLYDRKKVNEKLQQRKENLVLNELSKLSEGEEWTTAVLLDSLEKLSKFKTHTIAKCTIDFLETKTEGNEQLDRTHTPPAPLLTKSQQRVLTMLVVLNRTMPDIIQLVQAGIEFRLFRLGHAPEVIVIEELARVFTALARIQKDREKVRILCCDALYCLGLKAMPLIYVILVSWPEVFPMAGSTSDPLLLCLIDSIMTQTGHTTFPKFFALKKLLTGYYSYDSSGYVSNIFAKNLMTTLKERRQNGLDTAIILLSKKKGPVWSWDNIIQGGLLQMIVQKAHPSIYDAFCLLGHLMRSFPVEDKEGLVKNIIEQLSALMESGEGSAQQLEGIANALISLHRHGQNVVAKAILKWEPSEPLSDLMTRQLTAIFHSRPPNYWAKCLRNS